MASLTLDKVVCVITVLVTLRLGNNVVFGTNFHVSNVRVIARLQSRDRAPGKRTATPYTVLS
jgi:hypothetical protein